jgi:hypothetical protein
MKISPKSLGKLAEMICGDKEGASRQPSFPYRSSFFLTRFFQDINLPYSHDGTTRKYWVEEVLKKEASTAATNPALPPDSIIIIVQALLDARTFEEEKLDAAKALEDMNAVLKWDGLRVFIDATGVPQFEAISGGARSTISVAAHHKAWTEEEKRLRGEFEAYLDSASEDQITEHLLVPLFTRIGFQRISVSGHKDKRLEYGTDLWMKFSLPTRHVLYFGCQIKKEKIDATGRSDTNVATILNQITMMLGNEIWDTELNRKQLLDHVYIISGGEITKQARNWLGQKLDADKRRHIIFMDRPELLDLFIANGLTLPVTADEQPPF